MEVLASAVAYGMLVLTAIAITLVLAILAIATRKRAVGVAMLLGVVVAAALLAWPRVYQAFGPPSRPHRPWSGRST